MFYRSITLSSLDNIGVTGKGWGRSSPIHVSLILLHSFVGIPFIICTSEGSHPTRTEGLVGSDKCKFE